MNLQLTIVPVKSYYIIEMIIERFKNTAIIRCLKTSSYNRYLFVLSIVGFIAILLSTAKYGVVISHDSVSYIAAAKSLVSGNGFICYNGSPYVNWPPLFPISLAVFSIFGAEPLDISRWLNAFIFAALILASGKLFKQFIKNETIALLAAASILISIPLFQIYRTALSESLFILLAVFFVCVISNYLANAKTSNLLLVSSIAALCCLQRYIGITIVITGVILIFIGLRKMSWLIRLKHAAIFCLISLTPLFLWIIRNYTITSTFAGKRVPSEFTIGLNLAYAIDSLTSWFLTPQIPSYIRTIIAAVFLLIAATLFIMARFQNRNLVSLGLIKSYPATVFIIIYFTALIISSTCFAYDPIGHRLLLPVYVFIILYIFLGIELLINIIKSSAFKYKSLLHNCIIAVCTASLLCSLTILAFKINVWIHRDAAGYGSDVWQESCLMNTLDMLPVKNCKIYSNAPMEIFIYKNRYANMSPRIDKDIAEFKDNMSSTEANYLVWFTNNKPYYLYQLDELAEYFQLEKIVEVEDGAIYYLKKY